MSEMICNIVSQKNIFLNKANNYFNIIYESDLSESVFNKLNQYLLHQAIEFDNVFTEEKKDNEDKNIICANFIINNLLHILNKKDINFDLKQFNDIKDDKIEKKKTERPHDSSLNAFNFFKNIEKYKKNKIKETFNILKTKKVSSELINNKNHCNLINKINNDSFLKEININNINRKNISFIKDEKKITFSKDIKQNKSNLFLSKNINKIDNVIVRRNSIQIFNKKEYIKSNVEPLTLNDSQNSIEWKKLISHKILLSISNKDNQAEIHLKPESLGNIHIIINMKNNAATLKFISQCKKIRIFLDNYMPYLRNSLMKNGIKLENFNICSSSKNKQVKNYKNISRTDSLMQYKLIDIYV